MAYLFSDTRARVYLLWGVLSGVGFTLTHFYQMKTINGLWFIFCVLGLGYMYRVMPMRVRQMKLILISWLVPLLFGMSISGLSFYLDALGGLVAYLGVFWLVVMAAGYLWNGLVDNDPAFWYYVAFVLNIAGAILCYALPGLLQAQYIVAAIISVWSMANLWLLRSFDS